METELDQFTALLYDHKFDIDDILVALCGSNHQGRWLLNSRTNNIIQEQKGDAATSSIKDGDDNNHWHVITPLSNNFLTEMQQTPAFHRLTTPEKSEIKNILDNTKEMQDLTSLFNKGFAGGWIRERIKDAALLWLDSKDMIPPSMKHVYRKHVVASRTTPDKIILQQS